MEIIDEKLTKEIDGVRTRLENLRKNKMYDTSSEICFYEGYLTALNEVYCGLYCSKTEERSV